MEGAVHQFKSAVEWGRTEGVWMEAVGNTSLRQYRKVWLCPSIWHYFGPVLGRLGEQVWGKYGAASAAGGDGGWGKVPGRGTATLTAVTCFSLQRLTVTAMAACFSGALGASAGSLGVAGSPFVFEAESPCVTWRSRGMGRGGDPYCDTMSGWRGMGQGRDLELRRPIRKVACRLYE